MANDRGANVDEVLRRQLFFIAATEKSGTTWMQMMLDAHPEIACRGEGQFVSKLAPLLGKALHDYSDFVDGLNKKVFAETPGFPLFDNADRALLVRIGAALLLSKYGLDESVKAVGEKTPGNIRVLPALRSIFQGCKLVLMIRDGRDVVVSGHVHLKRQHGAAGEEPLENYARRVARVWAADVGRARETLAAAAGDCVLVRYEDLHNDPAAALKPVLELLNVENDAAAVSACVEAGRFETLSGGRARGEENAGSQFRKGVVGDWRGVLDGPAREAVFEEAGQVLRDFGYAETDAWVEHGG